MLDRKIAPRHAEITSFHLPSPEIHKLSSGVPLFVLGGVSQQVIKIELVFSGSKWDETKSGLSYFTAQMLEKGTVTKTSFEIADYFDRHGASVEISPGFDFVSVSLFSLTKNIPKVLPLFTELVTSSVFPDNELTLQKEIFNQNLKINNEKTSYVASKLIKQHLFGNSHPYGRSIEEDDVNQLTTEDLNIFFHNQFSLIKTFVVGSLDEALLNLLISELAVIPVANPKKNHLNFPVAQNKSTEYLKRPTSIQSSLRLGKRTINRNHEDYPALVLINHIFGGYFGSRLMKNIREDKGLTYGIYSSINNLKNDAFFVIAADVNRLNKDVAIAEIKNELNILCNKLIGIQELQNAKNHLLGSLQLEIANPFAVIDKIKIVRLYGLDENFYNDLFLDILDLNELTLQRVANNNLTGDFIEVVVG
jgi:zinc protease